MPTQTHNGRVRRSVLTSIDDLSPSPNRQLRATWDAYDTGTMVGFCLGLAAAVVGWFILSGHLVEICVWLVNSTLVLVEAV